MSENLLPVHGFVLAGGKSSRMGVDKATLEFCGRPMVEIAVEKLRGFCADVSIAGNREDLGGFAEVVCEERLEAGPAAGIEAGLRAAKLEWVMFVPVDVPLVPEGLLRRWVASVIHEQAAAGCDASFLIVNKERQPAFCMLRRDSAGVITKAIESGEQRISGLLYEVDNDESCGWLWACDAARFAPDSISAEMERWFLNVNTKLDLVEAEAWAAELRRY